ncbi:MAG: hypothetical protein H5T92_04705 [Synergistales bacterium]|nr:hypothetical protein [Synergistales bacterium]
MPDREPKKRILLLALLAAAVLSAALPVGCGRGEKNAPPPAGSLAGKRVVMVVARRDFRDEELFETKKALEGRGARVVVASSSLEEARGIAIPKEWAAKLEDRDYLEELADRLWEAALERG